MISNLGRRSLALLTLVVVLGCGQRQSSPNGDQRSPPILALVAASTQDAVQEIAAEFTREHGVEVRLNADDTSKLAAQIVNGAPADLFLSANEKWSSHVKEKGFVEEAKALLGNSLVLVVPRGNPLHLASLEELATPKVKKVALAGPTVPAGMYARQALTHLQLLDDLEKQKKIVSGENVRVALTYVERAEVDAGIVYATDARLTDKVATVATFSPSAHAPIIYPLVLLKPAEKNAKAREFYEYLQGAYAARIFRKYGFTWLAGN
jgi:molybdate transport system substrate-binding protein